MEKNCAFAIGDIGSNILARAGKSPSYIEIFSDWKQVVGEEIAEMSSPHKVITNGNNKVLILKSQKGKAVELQHESQKILKKVHDFLGNIYFSQLKIIQIDTNEKLTSNP